MCEFHFYFSTHLSNDSCVIPFLSTMSPERELETELVSNFHTYASISRALPTQEPLHVLLCPGMPRFIKLLS